MVCIAQHHRDRFPPAQLLDRIDIDARLNEPGRERMPEVMEAEPRDPRLAHRRIEGPQQIARLPWVPRLIDEHRLCAVRRAPRREPTKLPLPCHSPATCPARHSFAPGS